MFYMNLLIWRCRTASSFVFLKLPRKREKKAVTFELRRPDQFEYAN